MFQIFRVFKTNVAALFKAKIWWSKFGTFDKPTFTSAYAPRLLIVCKPAYVWLTRKRSVYYFVFLNVFRGFHNYVTIKIYFKIENNYFQAVELKTEIVHRCFLTSWGSPSGIPLLIPSISHSRAYRGRPIALGL